jgi:hypothetical protein
VEERGVERSEGKGRAGRGGGWEGREGKGREGGMLRIASKGAWTPLLPDNIEETQTVC